MGHHVRSAARTTPGGRAHVLLLAFTVLAALLLPVGAARAQVPVPADCAPLALASFGDPGAAVAEGVLAPGAQHCVRVELTAGGYLPRVSATHGEVTTSLANATEELGCYASEGLTSDLCMIESGGTYTMIIRNFGAESESYRVSMVSLASTTGCVPMGTRWDEPPTTIQPLSPLQVDCRTFAGRPGERIARAGAIRLIAGPSGTSACVHDGGDGCVLSGSGPYRTVSHAADRSMSAYRLRIGSLSAPLGCTSVALGAFGSAPAGPAETSPCRTLSAPAAGRYLVSTPDPAQAGRSPLPSTVYRSDGRRLCAGDDWCTFPSAGQYHVLVGDFEAQPSATVYLSAAGTDGCTPLGPGPYRGTIGTVGEYDCLALPFPAEARLALVQDASTPRTVEILDANGTTVCAGYPLADGTCPLTGAAPFRVIVHGAPGPYGLQAIRTDLATGCPALPVGTFADGSPSARLTTGGGVFAGCYTIAADQHTAGELVQFQRTSGTAPVSLSTVDTDGRKVCEHTGAANGFASCRLTAGKTHTVVVRGRDENASYTLTRRDVTATAPACGQLPATTVGGAAGKGVSGAVSTLRCHRVTTAATTDVVRLDIRDAQATTQGTVYDSAGRLRCFIQEYGCPLRGSTSYQVVTHVPTGKAVSPEYRLDAWRLATLAGYAAECARPVSVAYGYGPVTGVLSEGHTADCAVLPTRMGDNFDALATETAALSLYSDTDKDWLEDSCSRELGRCYTPTDKPSLLVVGLAEKSSQSSYEAKLTCHDRMTCGENVTLASFSPVAATVGTTATLTVKGTAIPSDAEVSLAGAGATLSPASVKVSADWRTLTAVFDLRGAPVGDYRLTVGDMTAAGTFKVAHPPLANMAKPSVKGAALVGAKLTALPGTWPDGPTSYTYQWKANGTPISGAVSATYVVPASMRAKSLSVAVSAHKSGWSSATAESAAVVVSAARRDHLGSDGFGDMLTLNSSGSLTFQQGTGSGSFGSKVSASGWSTSVRAVPFGDVNGDRCNDVLVRVGDALRAYRPGCGKALAPSTSYVTVGTSGWSQYNVLTSPGDLSGDGRADLLARQASTGDVYLYKATSDGKLASRVRIRSGWLSYTHIVGAGDLNGDGHGDVLARRSDGTLYRYDGIGNGLLKERVAVFTGWGASYTAIVGVGDITGDGKADLVSRDKYGVLFRNSGNGAGSFYGRQQIATGWTYTGVF
ncbi:FG-GAP-like repeat-containing protein [Streptomyces polyrhachis]|uniref:FG-GAP-like repeat-containing protein n=1 Tax=Streptomyces polyrhachis TaxID=1282885 RepID=A0ABW2GJH9_9ACTN